MRQHGGHVDGPPLGGSAPPALASVQPRRLYRHGNSVVLVLPPDLREVLGVQAGDVVMLVPTSRGTVEVVPAERPAPSHAVPSGLGNQVAALVRENRRLRRKLQARPVKLWNHAYNAGVMLGLRLASRDPAPSSRLGPTPSAQQPAPGLVPSPTMAAGRPGNGRALRP